MRGLQALEDRVTGLEAGNQSCNCPRSRNDEGSSQHLEVPAHEGEDTGPEAVDPSHVH